MIFRKTFAGLVSLGILAGSFACQGPEGQDSTTANAETAAVKTVGEDMMPEWAINANIYEVNIRQYTPEGTFNAFAEHLDRLSNMGVKILWLMPISPISETKKKGSLGSYYAITDYKGVNPEFGTEEDFKALVDKIHALDMKVILDWVPNHTGWDHKWIKESPDYYTHVADTITHPFMNGELTDWYDVAELNYDNMEMREDMIKCMEYWVNEFDVDGYRCDVAFEVPDDFWTAAVDRLRALKPVFMLAEAEHPPHRNSGAFHMSYPWSFMHLTNEIGAGHENVNMIDSFLMKDTQQFKKGFQMSFTTNHDENSWNGSEFERFGDGHKAFAVLVSTLKGMPLIYSGQEEPLKKRLAFFDKDTIGFQNYEYEDFYKTLLNLKKENKALWNGEFGGHPMRINASENVYAFKREKEDDAIVVVVNLSGDPQETKLSEQLDGMKEVFTEETGTGDMLSLGPWEYRVFEKQSKL